MVSRLLDPHNSRATIVETDVPARLDALPWGQFHTLVVVALGITWILDGLEVTLAGAVAGVLKNAPLWALPTQKSEWRAALISPEPFRALCSLVG